MVICKWLNSISGNKVVLFIGNHVLFQWWDLLHIVSSMHLYKIQGSVTNVLFDRAGHDNLANIHTHAQWTLPGTSSNTTIAKHRDLKYDASLNWHLVQKRSGEIAFWFQNTIWAALFWALWGLLIRSNICIKLRSAC